ncbi:hypothetical protein DENSPDRAFT_837850 [Dentipellis sp. KUC8613]|nr:hypothetical protein DENSPDRAFT_837850 [Dentipellis sp. KUC8613]
MHLRPLAPLGFCSQPVPSHAPPPGQVACSLLAHLLAPPLAPRPCRDAVPEVSYEAQLSQYSCANAQLSILPTANPSTLTLPGVPVISVPTRCTSLLPCVRLRCVC